MKFISFLKVGILFLAVNSNAQVVEFTTSITPNKITTFDNQKLILLDFWATWCGPCVAATKQMEIFQEENKNKLFVFSVTDEGENIVQKYLIKKPINLMVVSDLEKKYIDKYDIKSRPFAVLIDLKSNLIWKGHPADLSTSMLNKFYDTAKKQEKISFQELVVFKPIEKIDKTKLNENIAFSIKKIWNGNENFIFEDGKVNFSGRLSKLLSFLNDKSIFDIEIDPKLDIQIDIICSQKDWKDKLLVQNKISEKFGYVFSASEKEQEAFELVVDNKNMLWNQNEINWDDSSAKYLVGTDRIKANNASLQEVANILSEAKNKSYIYLGKNESLYDWDFQFLYDDLMQEDLISTFGIEIKSVTKSRTITVVSLPN